MGVHLRNVYVYGVFLSYRKTCPPPQKKRKSTICFHKGKAMGFLCVFLYATSPRTLPRSPLCQAAVGTPWQWVLEGGSREHAERFQSSRRPPKNPLNRSKDPKSPKHSKSAQNIPSILQAIEDPELQAAFRPFLSNVSHSGAAVGLKVWAAKKTVRREYPRPDPLKTIQLCTSSGGGIGCPGLESLKKT